ncbi:hypothetical protein D3C78_1933570 [compost metagenome]
MTNNLVGYSAMLALTGKVGVQLHEAALRTGRVANIQQRDMGVGHNSVSDYSAFACAPVVILGQNS